MKKLFLLNAFIIASSVQGAAIGAMVMQYGLQPSNNNLQLNKWELLKDKIAGGFKKTFVGESVCNEQTGISSFNEPYCGTRFRRFLATGSLCLFSYGIFNTSLGITGNNKLLKNGLLMTGLGLTGMTASLCLDEMRDSEQAKLFLERNNYQTWSPSYWDYLKRCGYRLFLGGLEQKNVDTGLYEMKDPLIYKNQGVLFVNLSALNCACVMPLFVKGFAQLPVSVKNQEKVVLAFACASPMVIGLFGSIQAHLRDIFYEKQRSKILNFIETLNRRKIVENFKFFSTHPEPRRFPFFRYKTLLPNTISMRISPTVRPDGRITYELGPIIAGNQVDYL